MGEPNSGDVWGRWDGQFRASNSGPPNSVYDTGSCEERSPGALRSSPGTGKQRVAELGPGRPGEGALALHCRLEPVCLGAREGEQRPGPAGDLACLCSWCHSAQMLRKHPTTWASEVLITKQCFRTRSFLLSPPAGHGDERRKGSGCGMLGAGRGGARCDPCSRLSPLLF